MTTKPTATDLRALVSELKPRSPQEVMGAAASSNLMASMFTAAATSIGLLCCATILMFSLGFGPANQPESTQLVTAEPSVSQSNAEVNANGAQSRKPSATAAAPDGISNLDPEEATQKDSVKGNAIEAMGIGEAAEPDSKPDSLENRLDKILDGLE